VKWVRLVTIALLTFSAVGCAPRDPNYKSKPIDPDDRTRYQPRYQQERQGSAAGAARS
jgi:hypothetical protein